MPLFTLHRARWRLVLPALFAAGVLSACGGGKSAESGASEGLSTNGVPVRRDQPANTEGRLLASNCFQCHGTGGTGGFEAIRGSEADEVREYRNLASKSARSDIMAAHAQGYTDEQIAAVIRYLQQ